MDRPLQNRVAIVTGGAQGLGAAICQRLAREGAHVVVADLNLAGAEQTAAAVWAEMGQRGLAQADKFSWDRAAEETLQVYESLM